MKNIPLDVLKKSRLFKNIEEENIIKMLKCISVGVKIYEKNEILVMQHEPLNNFGIILEGTCQIVKDDFEGIRTIVSTIGVGDFFGEAIVFSSFKDCPVSIVAKGRCKVLWLSKECVIKPCEKAHFFHNTFVLNILEIISNKNYSLNKKLDILSQRTIKDKLLVYFYSEAERNTQNKFNINYSKSDLAEFIGVERTAMYRVLKQLESENVIKIEGKSVTVLKNIH
ncbi:MAG: Crp/Fnr family transcriptional regulator [Lachnospirales bacterium]